MSDQEAQVSWLALEEGMPVYAEGGEEIGKVAEIVADAQ
ncbi:MAG: PRC-barrel domain-containing protein, partial [Actinobacteria bacterium]|nr:PRC-barrel domain-containing protein [Actinomycetota bacterium]